MTKTWWMLLVPGILALAGGCSALGEGEGDGE